jgi:hypothetical protein
VSLVGFSNVSAKAVTSFLLRLHLWQYTQECLERGQASQQFQLHTRVNTMTQSSTIKVGSGMVVVLLMLVSFGINSAQGGCVCVGDFASGNCQGDLVVDGAEDIVRPRHPSPNSMALLLTPNPRTRVRAASRPLWSP